MNDDDLSPLPPELQSLFDAERRREGPSSSSRDRVHQALLVSIAAGAGLGAGAASATAAAGKAAVGSGAALASGGAASTTAAAAGAAAATTTAAAATTTATGGALAKGLAFALVTAMAGTAGTGVYLAQKDDKPAVVADHRPVTEVPATFDPSVLGRKPQQEPAPVVEPPAPAEEVVEEKRAPVVEVIRPSAPEPTHEERAARLQGERAVLEEARGAITRNDPGAALIALEAHRAQYASGALVEEREALTVLALVKLGRTDEARKKADAFRASWPKSLLLPAVDAAIR